jgi:hypothetical protein
VDLLHELAIIRLLDSVDRTDKSGRNKHAAAAARARLKASQMSSPPLPSSVNRDRLAQALLRRLREIADRPKLLAHSAVGCNRGLPNGQLSACDGTKRSSLPTSPALPPAPPSAAGGVPRTRT